MLKKNKLALSLLLACSLLFGAAAALADVSVAGEAIAEKTEDLIVDYNYPVFETDDDTLAERLQALITQPCLDLYDTLYAQYEAFAADRTEEQAALYAEDEDYRDTITGEYEIMSNNERLLQIVTPTGYQPAGGNGNWWSTRSYVFDIGTMRLLQVADLFEEDAETVYEALSDAAQAHVAEIEGAYDDAQAIVTIDTSFYITEGENVIHFIFNPYTLSPSEDEIALAVADLPLTLAPSSVLAPEEEAEPMADMPNPMREATEDEINEYLGTTVHLPEGATDVMYFVYEFGDLDSVEVQFSVDGASCVFSAQHTDALVDVSGMYIDFAVTEEGVKVGENEATIKLNEDAEGICIWFDAANGTSNSLTMLEGASVEKLTDMANALFAEA